jgi:hypothetical protein
MTDGIQCYACGHEYRFLGRQPPHGRCPECRSHCVSPAGDLTVVADVDASASGHPPQVTVLAIDERFRHFVYHFAADRTDPSLRALQVDGHLVRPANKAWTVPVPDPVSAAVAAEHFPERDVTERL